MNRKAATIILPLLALVFLQQAEAAPARALQAQLFAAPRVASEFALGLQVDNYVQSSNPTVAAIPASGSPISTSGKKVNRGGAMLRSLVIPGWGESYLGYHGTARAFFWADVALWTTVIGLETYSRWRQDQFVSFAASHAGAQMAGKSDGFYADIGNYTDTEAYNEVKLRNRDYEAVYSDPAYFWAWDSDQNRMDYDHIRIQSRSAHNKVFFFIGAAALNRLISLVDSGKKATEMMRSERHPAVGFRFVPEYENASSSVRLVMTASLDR